MGTKHLGRRTFLAGLGACVASLSGCMDTDRTEPEPVQPGPSAGDAVIDGTFHESLVLFRNDDPGPWTDPDVLRRVDDVFAERDVPLTHGIVARDTDRNEELGPEHPVCRYLTGLADERGEQIGFAVHGYTHDRTTSVRWGSEFAGLSVDRQRRRIETATEIVESCLDAELSVFVPPFNTYDEQTVAVLRDAGFSLVSGGEYFQEAHFGRRGFWRDDGIVHLPTNLSMEDWETETVRDAGALRTEFDRNQAVESINVVMLHYYFYDDAEARETLVDLVEHAIESEGVCMTLDEFGAKATAGDIERLGSGWLVAS